MSAGLDLLVARGAAAVPHPGGTLVAHLRRVGDRLAVHGAGDVVRAAGLCHAAYGTDGFPTALLDLRERPRLRAAIGAAAEGLVHRYASCDRAHLYPQAGDPEVSFRDRFTGEVTLLPADGLRPFVAVTVANELDVADHSPAVTAADRASLLALFTRWRPLLTDAAWADVRSTLSR
jgi:hypothetical protein